MVTRFISKGKGRNRKAIPITPKKKGVSVRSVSLEPQAIQKINKKTIKTLNQGQSANFSSSLNKLITSSRLKRASDLRVIVFKDANKEKTFQVGTNTDLVEDLKFLQAKNGNKAEIIAVRIGTRKDVEDTLKRNGMTDERAKILVESAFGSERKARDTSLEESGIVVGQAKWTGHGRGFGHSYGWQIPNESFHSIDKRNIPESIRPKGAVRLDNGNMLDLHTGKIFKEDFRGVCNFCGARGFDTRKGCPNNCGKILRDKKGNITAVIGV